MPTTPAAPAAAPGVPAAAAEAPERLEAVSELVDGVVALVRVLHALKAQVAGRSAHGLLFPLSGAGPCRLTALAEMVHSDPSTTSRQVAELVREGLVRREPDPDDGRAVRLVVTDSGRAAVGVMRDERTRAVAAALADWSEEELRAFTADFHRFTRGLSGTLAGPLPGPPSGAPAGTHVPPAPAPAPQEES